MKVWVVYRDYGAYEGYGLPEMVFDSYEKAALYMSKNKFTHSNYEAVELELELELE